MNNKFSIATTPFLDQKPGTSGLRKKVSIFQEEHYLENFVQSIFDTNPILEGGVLVLGGDGRYFNEVAIQTILRMACANGVSKVIVGKEGVLSTPAVSHLIRKYKAQGGIILSASHNPAGVDGDFGIKFNIDNGGPAPEKTTEAIFAACCAMLEYFIIESEIVDLSTIAVSQMQEMQVDIISSVADYNSYMQEIFDFKAIAKLLSDAKFSFVFDAMHAVTGPYAHSIFEDLLGAPKGTVINGTPLADFGKGHPDPNLTHAKEIVDKISTAVSGSEAVDFAAASDGDGDRNMVLGKDFFVTPSDSLAFIFANANLIPFYQGKVLGVARSMPTSQAADNVAKELGLPFFETPTGWKFFGNLLDSDKITFCGEESFGTSSSHVREKDGLWAVLAWLNILAVSQKSVKELMLEHWQKFGRNFYTRYDYEEIALDGANNLMSSLDKSLPDLVGHDLAGDKIMTADQFSYTDPIDGSLSLNQGTRIVFESGARVVVRLSGTGTKGATLRIYFESFSAVAEDYSLEVSDKLANFIALAVDLIGVEKYTGRKQPTVVT